MRILLTIPLIFFFPVFISAQVDFKSYDRQTYDNYIKGDYKHLKRAADALLSEGIDYYYLRMRLGVISYNKHKYSVAVKNFGKALRFNSLDTISHEYIYYSYLLSGRQSDAVLYLGSIPAGRKNSKLKSIHRPGLSEVYAGYSALGSERTLYETNSNFYEAINRITSINAGFENYFSARLKGTFAYSALKKTGTVYSETLSTGIDLDLIQHNVNAMLTGYLFPGWEISGFGGVAIYNDSFIPEYINTEFVGGVGISKKGWRIRTGASISVSNFSRSDQTRGEAWLCYLPFGNLNLYLTSGGMYQGDRNWGSSYQVNQEIGFRITDFLWMETGIVRGNSFLYARNYGFNVNNSFQVPANTIYGNIIILPGRHFRITLTPFFTENYSYSWDIYNYSRTNKLVHKSFGGAIKFTYKNN